MKITDCNEEQINKICKYLKQKYSANNDRFWFGTNCACANCPFGIDDGISYGKVWLCSSYIIDTELSSELETIIKGDTNE